MNKLYCYNIKNIKNKTINLYLLYDILYFEFQIINKMYHLKNEHL